MKYKVIYNFRDAQDNDYQYLVGQEYPRVNGAKVSENRIDELSTNKNKLGFPVIEKIVEKQEIKEEKPEEIVELQPKKKKK